MTNAQLNAKMNRLILDVAAIKHQLGINTPAKLTSNDKINEIIHKVEKEFNVPEGYVMTRTRKRNVVEARMVSMFIASHVIPQRQFEIVAYFRMHHCTMNYYTKKIKELLQTDKILRHKFIECAKSYLSLDQINNYLC